MSRIHEALKRAEQEKTAGPSGQKVEDRGNRSPADQDLQPKSTIPNHGAPPPVASSKNDALPKPITAEDLRAKCRKPGWKPDPSFLVFSSSNPLIPGPEQFRTLRSRLYRIRENQPLQTVLISSAIPAEGKTVVATNLAHAMVRQQGCRVLLIDADLRAPRVHMLLGAPSNPGLADYLQGGVSEFDVIQRGHEEGFYFIPAGTHVTHPSELISSDRMKEFLERVKPAFDWILIDSSPVLPVADATVLGGMCEGVLLVVRANSTPAETCRKAAREFQDSQILGVVLNSADKNSEYGSYYASGAYGSAQPHKLKK
jgi:protein-tyrosine kinase